MADVAERLEERKALDRRGFFLRRGVVSGAAVANLIRAIERASPAARSRGGRAAGVRNLLSTVPEVRRLAAGRAIRALVVPVLGLGAFAVRGILFDKTREAQPHTGIAASRWRRGLYGLPMGSSLAASVPHGRWSTAAPP